MKKCAMLTCAAVVIFALLFIMGCASGTPMENAQKAMNKTNQDAAAVVLGIVKTMPGAEKVKGVTTSPTDARTVIWTDGTVSVADAQAMTSTVVATMVKNGLDGEWPTVVVGPDETLIARSTRSEP